MCAIFSAEEFCKLYSNRTGKFPITSSRGHKYILVFYYFDTKTINGIAIKSRAPPSTPVPYKITTQ